MVDGIRHLTWVGQRSRCDETKGVIPVSECGKVRSTNTTGRTNAGADVGSRGATDEKTDILCRARINLQICWKKQKGPDVGVCFKF